ncbi:MAG: transposase [Clostridium baratii]|uniref:transposase n=1 Tax=Clostridium baratii TaxID=1561 RepID=UPI00242A7792|nr:transposase [Clostridium baratii]MBS6006868.1 transposase [Clostridium baratii]
MNIVKKIKLRIIDNDKELCKKQYLGFTEEQKKELIDKQYKFIRDSQYQQYLGFNRAMGFLMSGYYANNMDIKSDNFKEHQKKLTNSLYIFDDIKFGVGIDSKSLIVQRVKKDFSTALKNGLAKGERSVTNYKRTYPLLTRHRSIKFLYAENELDIYLDWVNKIRFRCELGNHKNSLELQHTLRKVITGEYKISDSSLEFNKKNELILNLNLNIPETKATFIKDRTLGVDLGMAIPAYVSLSDTPYIRKGFGSYEEFAKVRNQFKDRRKRLLKQLSLVAGGKGRAKKLHSMEFLKNKEKQFAKTYNHSLSKKIIDFALKNNCEYINLEDIKSTSLEDRVLGQWGYYQLQEQIEYKAKLVGIKVRKVKAAYTSQTCSECGNIDKENRKNQSTFKCTNEDCKLNKKGINADWNASINIARSKEFIK